jgi:hypothetical protein
VPECLRKTGVEQQKGMSSFVGLLRKLTVGPKRDAHRIGERNHSALAKDIAGTKKGFRGNEDELLQHIRYFE